MQFRNIGMIVSVAWDLTKMVNNLRMGGKILSDVYAEKYILQCHVVNFIDE